MAQGAPIADEIADAAAHWLTLRMSGEMSTQDEARWQAWCAASPEHERAWRHIEAALARLGTLARPAALRSLASAGPPTSRRRRAALLALLSAGTAAAGGWSVLNSQRGRQWTADVRTRSGEQRSVTLQDGSQVMLNTDTAMDVAFDAQRRVLRLVAGEIMVTTRAGDRRPFSVETRDGSIRALGTRFIVRQDDAQTRVAVLESAVEITPVGATRPLAVLHAGERLAFDRQGTGPTTALDMQTTAWTRGLLIAEDARLGDFVAELARFRPGVLRCDPAVADLRFSGVFPVADTDRILALLPNSLPVAVHRRTAYWVTVGPAD